MFTSPSPCNVHVHDHDYDYDQVDEAGRRFTFRERVHHAESADKIGPIDYEEDVTWTWSQRAFPDVDSARQALMLHCAGPIASEVTAAPGFFDGGR